MSGDVANSPIEPVIQAVRRRGSLGRELVRHLLGVAGLALMFTFAGAFDTDDLGFLRAFTFWLIFGALIVGQVSALDWLFVRVAPAGALSRALAGCAAVVTGAGLMLVELSALKRTPLTPARWGFDPLWDYVSFAGPPLILIAAFVVLLRTPIARRTVDFTLIEDRAAKIIAISARPVVAGLLPPPRLLPVEISSWPDAPVRLVRAHDHYLEIFTAEGRTFARGRMRDAAVRLKDADGLQVHRSWWVASEAVGEVRRSGRDYTLVLADGQEIPVGRGRVQAMRAKGWI